MLIDKSAHEQANYSTEAAAKIDSISAEGRVATCVIVMGEMMYSARNADGMRGLRLVLGGTEFLHLTEDAEGRALDVSIALSERGLHRSVGLADVLTAAIAEVHGARVMHYDHDFDHIAAITGQPTEWIIPRGTGHGHDRA